MKRASAIKPAEHWNPAEAVDRVVLDADARQKRRGVFIGEAGTRFLLDLPRATMLHDGDGLVLDDASIICVVGQPEPLMEISAANAEALTRLAWHLGNRHTDVQVVGDTLCIRRDHVLEEMLRLLGARLIPINAPFDPEPGAYGHGNAHNGDDR